MKEEKMNKEKEIVIQILQLQECPFPIILTNLGRVFRFVVKSPVLMEGYWEQIFLPDFTDYKF